MRYEVFALPSDRAAPGDSPSRSASAHLPRRVLGEARNHSPPGLWSSKPGAELLNTSGKPVTAANPNNRAILARLGILSARRGLGPGVNRPSQPVCPNPVVRRKRYGTKVPVEGQERAAVERSAFESDASGKTVRAREQCHFGRPQPRFSSTGGEGGSWGNSGLVFPRDASSPSTSCLQRVPAARLLDARPAFLPSRESRRGRLGGRTARSSGCCCRGRARSSALPGSCGRGSRRASARAAPARCWPR